MHLQHLESCGTYPSREGREIRAVHRPACKLVSLATRIPLTGGEFRAHELRPIRAEVPDDRTGIDCMESHNRRRMVVAGPVRSLRLSSQRRHRGGHHHYRGRRYHVRPGEVHCVSRLVGRKPIRPLKQRPTIKVRRIWDSLTMF